MDREQELKKLINVLNRMSRTAVRLQWTGAGESEARFAVTQFNRILARLSELDEHVKGLFSPLAEDSTLTVVAMAARQVVSYYEDEVHTEHGGRFEGAPFFSWMGGKPVDFEELGNALRDCLHEWQRRERERRAERRSCG